MHFVKPNRKVTKVFLHCTAYPHQDLISRDLIDAINKWHIARGFREIGYHYVIDKDGRVLVGRSLEKIPSAQEGHNSKSIAICLDGLYFNQFNQHQFASLEGLVKQIDTACDNKITYHGHCEVSDKECPVFDYPAVLGLDRSGRRVGSYRYTTEKPYDSSVPIATRTLSLTSRGQDVIQLQKLLDIYQDGVFGRDTYDAVVNFQKTHDLFDDGVVGPITWRELLEHNS